MYTAILYDSNNTEHQSLYKSAQKMFSNYNLMHLTSSRNSKLLLFHNQDNLVVAYAGIKFLAKGRQYDKLKKTANAYILEYYRVREGHSHPELSKLITESIQQHTNNARLFAEVFIQNLVSLNFLARKLDMRIIELLPDFYDYKHEIGDGFLLQRKTDRGGLLLPQRKTDPQELIPNNTTITVETSSPYLINLALDSNMYATQSTNNTITFQSGNNIVFRSNYKERK